MSQLHDNDCAADRSDRDPAAGEAKPAQRCITSLLSVSHGQ
jgi:hypothetical protein